MNTLGLLVSAVLTLTSLTHADENTKTNYLVKFKSSAALEMAMTKSLTSGKQKGRKIKVFADQWAHVTDEMAGIDSLINDKNVEYVQPNYEFGIIEPNPVQQKELLNFLRANPQAAKAAIGDNPQIPGLVNSSVSKDPLISKQWGMLDMGAEQVWQKAQNNQNIIVAVIDSGVDYTHPDLAPNMWRNPGETGVDAAGRNKASNGIDDDRNGYVDDVVGYDFVSNDPLPFDKTSSLLNLALGSGGNSGHGTHCAGNVAARGNNGIGISGVAPKAQIMALRFVSEKGSGDTKAAVEAIRYAVDNGAKVLSNSWGSHRPNNQINLALIEAIQYAESKGVLFVTAAGNGVRGRGIDNDTAKAPHTPSSLPISNIISVAAIDSNSRLADFSDFGMKTVHIGAPGVKVFSTTLKGKYSDKAIPIPLISPDWEGTSMAAPHVAGAAALYWAQYPNKTMAEVKDAILKSAVPTPSLQNKIATGGKLNLIRLMQQ